MFRFLARLIGACRSGCRSLDARLADSAIPAPQAFFSCSPVWVGSGVNGRSTQTWISDNWTYDASNSTEHKWSFTYCSPGSE